MGRGVKAVMVVIPFEYCFVISDCSWFNCWIYAGLLFNVRYS